MRATFDLGNGGQRSSSAMEHGTTPTISRDPRLKEGWRAAAAAYRRTYGEVRNPHRGPADEAYAAAIKALKAALPGISHEEATRETIEAISYASSAHSRLYRS